MGSDSRPSEDSDDDRRPPRFSYASSASVQSEATFDDQQAMDWGQCLEPSVQPELRVISNDSVKGVASEMSTNEATPKQEK